MCFYFKKKSIIYLRRFVGFPMLGLFVHPFNLLGMINAEFSNVGDELVDKAMRNLLVILLMT